MTIQLDPFQLIRSINCPEPVELIVAGIAEVINDSGPQTAPCQALPNGCGGTIEECPGDYFYEIQASLIQRPFLDCRQGEFWTESQQEVQDGDGVTHPAGIRVYWGGQLSPTAGAPNCFNIDRCWYTYDPSGDPGGLTYNFLKSTVGLDCGYRGPIQILPQGVRFPYRQTVYILEPPVLSVGTITQSGANILVTPSQAGHQVENGRFIELSENEYAGRWTASGVTTTDFVLDATYTVDATGGKFQQVYSL